MKLRKILIAICILLLIAALIPIIHHYQLRFATNAYIAQLKVKGELVDLAQVRPPPVPAGQNSADTFRQAVSLFGSDRSLLNQKDAYDYMKIIAPGKAMAFSDQPLAVTHEATNSWEEVAAAVAQNKEAYDMLQQIIDKPAFDFQISYEKGTADLDYRSLYIDEVRNMMSRLQAAALSDLHRGDSSSSVQNVRAALALVKAMRTERLLTSESIRMAFAYRPLGITWEVLQSTNVTADQLAPLQRDWEDIQFAAAQENALALQRVIDNLTIQNWRKSDAAIWRLYGTSGSGPSVNSTIKELQFRSQIFLWRNWWSYRNELLALKGYQVLLDTSRFQKTNASWLLAIQQMRNNLAKLAIPRNQDEGDLRYAFSSWVISWSTHFDRVIASEAEKQLAVGAIALKRYRLKHGRYPPDLASLVPEFLSGVPRDPVDGQPLRYRLNPDGTFLLYSIGSDGKDDGGDPKGTSNPLGFFEGRDWVWPRPATPQEIENFARNHQK